MDDILQQDSEEVMANNKYMGYRVNDLSDSLGVALGKDDKLIPSTFISSLYYYFESITMDWTNLIPSLHTTLVLIYFLLMVCILLGISSYMWKKFDIKTRSQSKETPLEKQLLGSGKYAQYVNAAIAFKIYQQEMININYDSDSENELNENNESKDNSLINESILIGGYEKTKKLRARTIRKQKLRQEKENYQKYKKRLEYEKQLKRHHKMKEKKHAKKMKKQKKNSNYDNGNKNKNKNGWLNSMYHTIVAVFENNEEIINNKNHKLKSTKYRMNKCEKSKKENYKNNLEQMIRKDCCNEIIIDLDKYYLEKIQSSDIYCTLVQDMKSFKKLIKTLSSKYEECKGLIDDNSNVYFRWNDECEQQLLLYIENSGKCNVKQTGNKMLAISKKIFK